MTTNHSAADKNPTANVAESPSGDTGAVVGVVGLGNLGLPIARRLVSSGIDVVSFDVSPVAREAASGLDLAPSLRELAERSDVVLVLVSDADQCQEVLSEVEEVTFSASLPSVVVIMASVGPDSVRSLAAPLQKRGVMVVDVPVSGGAAAALNGGLSLMVGGASADIAACRGILEILGTVNNMGDLGAGQSAKLANQILFFGTHAALQEAIALAEADGVDRTALLQALSGGTADCWSVRHPGFIQETARAYDVAGIHPPQRPWHKDLRKAVEVTNERGVDAPFTAMLSDLLGDRIDRSVRPDENV